MNATRFSLFLTLTLLTLCAARGQTPVWSQLPNSPSGTSRHDDIYMLNSTTGWTARGRAGIFKTTDGGNTWVQKLNQTATHFRSIGFVDAMHGFAGNLGPGSYDVNVTDTNVMYETFNGGDTWVNHPGFREAGMQGLCSFHIFDSETIYGGGRVRGTNAFFIKSTDAGTNWTIINLTAQGVMRGIMDVYFKDKTNGFVVGMDTNDFYTQPYHGAIARTTNGGATWQMVAWTALNSCYFWKMSWPTPDVGYASLQQNGSMVGGNHIFYKTTDGGNTWVSNGIPFSAIGINSFYWQGVGFISETEGWAGGDAQASPINFLHTVDGGASWTQVGYPNSLSINRFRILSPTLAYASGQKLHVFRIGLAITAQPTNQTTVVGSNATFNVTAQGTAPLVFQWRFNGTNLAGANNNSYAVTNAQPANAGNYDVVVGDYSGSVTSSVATLTVNSSSGAPSITAQPQSQTVSQGANANFTVSASGTAPLSYQWRFNGTNLSGATDTSYTRVNAQPADAGNYSVVVTNSVGSVTSAVATLTVNAPTAPSITSQPQSQSVNQGANATFNVSASGTAPLSYQWRFSGTNLSGATDSSYIRINVQPADAGNYSVLATNVAGSVTSAVATLTVTALAAFFQDDFDSYGSPSIVTKTGTTNGYKIFFRAAGGAVDFKAIFGFDYSTVTYPTSIPPAPHSSGGTTKGLYLTVNKDTNALAAAVNLYPAGLLASGNFALKFDLWINWRDIATSTEHALVGINHSGNVTNRVGQSPSDGLFFAVEGENDSPATSTTLRDFSVFRGRGTGQTPLLMTTNNTTFGPAPLLGPQFDSADPGFKSLFPSKTIPGYGSTPAGSAGLGWISGEVRQENNLLTWLLNGTTIAQYTNTFAYTNGTILLGYNDNFDSIGDSNNFAIFDNIRVESIFPPPVITNQPQSQTVVGYNDATFTVGAGGTPPLSYQWRFGGAVIPGATESDYTRAYATASDMGAYDVVITNNYGAVTSAVATLTVVYPPAITNQPQGQWVSSGANVTFSVGVDGTSPFAYQWKKDGVSIFGATDSTLALISVVRSNSGAFTIVVTNAWGSATSSDAVLRVFTPQLLKAPQLTGGGTVQILFGEADAGPLTASDIANFEVLATTNLIDWVVLTNALSVTNGMMLLEDSATLPQRYYRVIEH